jgi:hypothetical protein
VLGKVVKDNLRGKVFFVSALQLQCAQLQLLMAVPAC